ncbi:type II toxin-antitoxin system HicB family antitoxin [Litchfieldia salsa]|uniref:Type II toxin-antitoxin system HicB family antitoxin n=1 Tax=Litchfieldia salsa TaxID=930152 RepID=A0A1H0T0A3_9BACI|nr:type II toxin-antitoxin system HicB family antitoxin [Litchfieldia salsa]SDP47036.1 hypothetical protein SAMN05216565_103198 [Litchfieldia salsa]
MWCFFPTLFPEYGWEYPLSRGETKGKALQEAKKDLAYSLAGILYDNEELPLPISIDFNELSEGMELIDIDTSIEAYAEDIKEHLKGRHWHVTYYDEKNDNVIEAIGCKNEQGLWDIFLEDLTENPFSQKNTNDSFLFTVKLRSEAEEKFNQFVETVILKRK